MTGERSIAATSKNTTGKQSKIRKKGRITRTVVTLITFGALGLSSLHGGTDPNGPGTTPVVPVTAPGLEIRNDDPVKVHFIDVGQGDSIYIQLPGHNDILIDAGDEEDGPAVVNYLHQQGMDDDIELLIATHPHLDHIGGIPDVMTAFQVDEVLDSGMEADSEPYQEYIRSINAEECPWVHDNHQTFSFGDIQLQILTGNELWDGVNNSSVVARLDCGQVEFLFPGDAEREAEERLSGDISAEILKVGHHGSNSSSSPGFLARVRPEVAVISAGAGNSYGHPHQETLSRLQELGIKVYRTDWDGSIVITTDGDQYWLCRPAQPTLSS